MPPIEQSPAPLVTPVLLDRITDGFYAFDREWRCVYVNRRGAELLGHRPEEMLGRIVWEVFPDAERHPAYAEAQRTLSEQTPARLEVFYPALSRWLASDLYPGPEGLTILARDITGQKRAERAHAELAAIVASSEDAIIGKTLDGTITSWNTGAERLYGYSAEEAIGRPIAMLLPNGEPDELPDILARLSRGEHIEPFETRRRRKDGTMLDVWLAISPICDDTGVVGGASAIARDISERKRTEAALRESEERFRTIAETANEGIWLIDLDARTLFANRRLAELLGTSVEALLGRTVPEFCFPEDVGLAEERIGRNLQGFPEQFDFRFRRADGTPVLVLACTSPVRDTRGTVVGALGMFSDITRRVAAEAERDAFVSGVTHDLRSPLTVIGGMAQTLLRQAEHTEQLAADSVRTGLAAIIRSADKMAGMLAELLDVSRLRAGQTLELHRAPIDIVALVRQCVAEIQQAAADREVRIVASVDHLVGAWDTQRMSRVFANLLSNAVKYSPQGSAITVIVRREAEEQRDWAVVAVQDEGLGIPAADLPRIFDWFHRGGNVAGRVGGTGIGLAGAKQIVEQHGGSITVESTEGVGSTFAVRLPLE